MANVKSEISRTLDVKCRAFLTSISLHLGHDRKWLASVYHEFGILRSRRSDRVTVAPHKAANPKKESIFTSQVLNELCC